MRDGAWAPAVSTAGDGAAGVGPDGAHVLRLASRHYENFPVLSRLLPRDLRGPFAAVYAFARTTDDLGDEGSATPAERLAALDRWERAFDLALEAAGHDGGAAVTRSAGTTVRAADHPDPERARETGVLAEVVRVIRDHALPPESFRALVEANRLDQRRARWATYEDLLGYCALSANPVGRIVLRLFESEDPGLWRASDAICTALQLANHWQGLGEDLRVRDRLYVPLEDLRRFGVVEEDLRRDRPGRAVRALLGFQLDRTRALLAAGQELPAAFSPAPRAVLRLFVRGGRAILDRLEARQEDLLRARVRVGRRRRVLDLAAEALALGA